MLTDEALAAEINTQPLGIGGSQLPLHGRHQFQLAAQRLCELAQRQVDIFTHDLDKPLYDQPAVLDQLKRLALSSRGICVHILLQNSEPAQQQGHRLIELARRLTSRIEIRRPHDDLIDHRENFLIADRMGILRRRQSDRYEGEVNFHDPLESKRLSEWFTEAWEQAEPDSSLRRLYL